MIQDAESRRDQSQNDVIDCSLSQGYTLKKFVNIHLQDRNSLSNLV